MLLKDIARGLFAGLAILCVGLLFVLAVNPPAAHTRTVVHTRTVTRDTTHATTVYVRNLAPRYMSDAEIRNDIPAWERSINRDFAPIWHTGQYRIVLIGRRQAPKGGLVATFVKSGQVQGALAYHFVDKGVPGIVVYAGTGVYFGYDNSVSFTHELEELAADPEISIANQGYPYDWVWLQGRDPIPQIEGTVWANEVSDPVEADSYHLRGADGKPVKISDFVTPNWFNDAVDGPYDFMHLVQQPFTILAGGYAQFDDTLGWQIVTDFRKAVASDAGFLKGEHDGRSSR